MKPWAEQFYKSDAWQKCRESYMKKVGGLCEICLQQGIITPAEIVHHKIRLGPSNIDNPAVTMNFDNLQALCRKHHGEVHSPRTAARRYEVDAAGHVWARD